MTSIGQSRPLIDGRPKITGHARYIADMKFPGMLYARLVLSTHAHANILAVNKKAALAIPGVVDVLTAEDLPAIVPSSRSRLLLARGRVIFTGQPVAMILAESEAAAADAAELVDIDYEPLPAAVTIDDALADGAPLVWPNGVPSGSGDEAAHGADVGSADKDDKPLLSNRTDEVLHEAGDVQTAFASADVIVEHIFMTPMAHQSSLETQGVIAQPDLATGGIHIWASTQAPFETRNEVAEILNIPESDVNVTATTVGGGFGGKFGLYEQLVAVVAYEFGRPVRLILSRMEELISTNPAPPIRIKARLAAKNDGTLLGLEAQIHVDSGCYPTGLAGFGAFMMGSFYRIPNYRLEGANVLTFKQSSGAYRAPAIPLVVFALDSLIDEVAERLGLDPLEFRLRHAARPGDKLPNGSPWPDMGLHQTLEALREHPLWKNRDSIKKAGRGVGIAVGGWMGGREPGAAICKLNRDGMLQIQVGSVDLTGTMTGFTILAAEAFGVTPDQVRVVFSDTDHAPYSGGTGGSKVTYTMGSAVVKAAEDARKQTLEIAAEEFEASVEDLEIVEGKVQVKGVPEKAIKLGDVAGLAMQFGGRYRPVHGNGRTAITAQSPAFSAQLAEVEVDEETGAVIVHSLIVAQDVGRAINPMIVEGQMMGGATQGLGWALYEEMIYDENGQLLTGTWMDYTVPDAMQVARKIEVVMVEVPSEHGPFGARGVGEPPVIPTPATIANAIAHATGARISTLPMTPPRIMKALHERNQS